MTLLQFISKENFVKVKPAAASKTGNLHSFKSIIQKWNISELKILISVD